jgi:hypothetical protein
MPGNERGTAIVKDIRVDDRVRLIGSDLISVQGPAVIRTGGVDDVEILTDVTLKFKIPCEVWLKVEDLPDEN